MKSPRKAVCDNCKRLANIKTSHFHKDKFLCGKCFKKSSLIIRIGYSKTLEYATNKEYLIRSPTKEKKIGVCWFPKILIGRKFKITLL